MATKAQKSGEAVTKRTREAAARSPSGVPTAPAKKATRVRSAKSGEMVSKSNPDPDTTVTERVEAPLDEFIRKFKTPKVPKSEGAMADLLYTAREDRLRLQKVVDQIAQLESDLKNHFIENLSKKDSTGVAGKRARVQIVTEDVPQVEDWDAAYAHIKKRGEFDLLNRALNRAAVKARWDAGKEVPGVRHFQATKVSVTKV